MENNEPNNKNSVYKESGSTGMLGTFLFFIFMIIVMAVLYHFKP